MFYSKSYIFLLIFGLGLYMPHISAQIRLKTEYIGNSKFVDADNEKTGGKGDARIYQADFKIPLSIKLNENNRPTAWAIGLGGSYASLHNQNISTDSCPSKIVNTQLTLIHIRPLNEKWSLMAALGAGIYAGTDDISDISGDNILGQGGVIFIRHLKPNLDIGGGLALNNSFGYPMVFPAFYINWKTEGRYQVKVAMMNAFEVSAGMQIKDYFRLNLMSEMNGMLALTKKDGKKMMFTHQYLVAGIQPEFVIGKSLTIPITMGVSTMRNAYVHKRTLKAMFESMEEEYTPHFGVAPYCAVSIKYGI